MNCSQSELSPLMSHSLVWLMVNNWEAHVPGCSLCGAVQPELWADMWEGRVERGDAREGWEPSPYLIVWSEHGVGEGQIGGNLHMPRPSGTCNSKFSCIMHQSCSTPFYMLSFLLGRSASACFACSSRVSVSTLLTVVCHNKEVVNAQSPVFSITSVQM